MARYYFNIRDGVSLPDVDGIECPTIDHARREAVRVACYMLMTQPGKFWGGGEWFVEVTNAARDMLFRVKFQAEDVAPSATPHVGSAADQAHRPGAT